MAKRITVDDTKGQAPAAKKKVVTVEAPEGKVYSKADMKAITDEIMGTYTARIEALEAKIAEGTKPKGDKGEVKPVSVEAQERAYEGQWGPEWICEVENIEDRQVGMVWNVLWQGDERRFVNGGKVQLSPAHINVLRDSVIREQKQIPQGSGYYWNAEEAEKHNPGMTYRILNGRPWLTRDRRRYVVQPIEPAMTPPLLHGGISE